MANKIYKNRDLAVLVMRCVLKDDVIGAKNLLVGIDEQDKKMIVSAVVDRRVPLCVAAERGNTDMVKFLVKDCQADIEDRDFNLQTPLWIAASHGKLEVVKLLLGFGADINAVAKTRETPYEIGRTPVNEACSGRREETAKFLIRQGADINRPGKFGQTCLRNSTHNLELCQLLIEYGARVNDQDNFGDTALHIAILWSHLEIVQLLLDHGSDQNIKNNQGDDALQLASLHGKDSIVMELVARQEPTPLRWVESQTLLGSHCLFSGARDETHALVYWKRAVILRLTNPYADSSKIEQPPVFRNNKEVNTVEELEELCQDEQMAYMYAIENRLRIVNLCHHSTIDILYEVCNVFAKNGSYRRSFGLLRYAFQLLLEARTQTWSEVCFRRLEVLNWKCSREVEKSLFEMHFHDVLEILDMVTSNAQCVKQVYEYNSPGLEYDNSLIINPIFSLVQSVSELNKSPDQIVSFKRVVHRLVSSKMKTSDGRTFLHLAVGQFCLYQDCLNVVELLLECGADVNALDRSNNTALRLCTQPYLKLVSKNHEQEVIIELLLRYSAHVDIVNDSGDIAAKGLQIQILDHVNLKCLAAAVIRDRRIPYVGRIPVHLEPFVQMHGRCP